MKDLLLSLGPGYLWTDQQVDNVTNVIRIVKQRLQDMCMQTLREIINVSSKGRYYRNINVNYNPQGYFRLIPHKNIL